MVTIFPGPGAVFRVRELDDECDLAITVRWFCFYGDAVEYIREMYNGEQVVSPDAFRQEILRRKAQNVLHHVHQR